MVKAFPRFTLMQKKIDKLNSGIQEALTNLRVIKSFVREDYEEEKFQTMNQDLKDSSLNAMKIVIATMPIMMFAMNVTTLAVVWYLSLIHIWWTDLQNGGRTAGRDGAFPGI